MDAAKTMTAKPPTNGRPPSKGRQRIEIAPIKNKTSRQVTCSKRKSGLFKKASELALLCGAHIAAIIFSDVGNVYAFGSPSVDSVLRRVAPLPGEPYYMDDEIDTAAVEGTLRQAEETAALVEKEKARMAAIGEKVLQAVPARKEWWDADVQQLGEAELPEFRRALLRLRKNVQLRANNAPLPVQ